MASGTYDSSYDLNQAATLANRLHQRLKKSPGSFPAKPISHEAAQPPRNLTKNSAGLEPPTSSFEDQGVFREAVWQALLGWAMRLSDAVWAYVSDAQGLIIAERGQQAKTNADETSSRIANAFHLLSHDGSQVVIPNIISLSNNHGWMTCLSCPLPHQSQVEDYLLIGLFSTSQTQEAIAQRIHEVFTQKISGY